MSNHDLPSYLTALAIEELEVSTINNEVIQQHETISDALANTIYLDKIQAVVSDSGELSQMAMSSINLAVESICQNLGAPVYKYINTLSVESLTTESYKRVAFEDVQIFVKDLWTKIKESVNKLWDKVNEFWQNNFSSLGKIKAALDIVLDQVNKQYKRDTPEEASNPDINLLHNFNNGKDIDQRTVDGFVNAHYTVFNTMDELIRNTRHFNKFVKYLTQDDFDNDVDAVLENISKNFIKRTYRLGCEQSPMITGEFITIEYVQPENAFDIEFMSDEQKVDAKDNAKLFMLDKDKLRNVINKTIAVIRETIKYRDVQVELQKEFNNLTSIYDKHIEDHGIVIDYDDMHRSNTNLLKNYKKTIRVIYRINVSIPKILGTIITSNVKLARSVVQYSHFCLTH
ncbi:MAG: hypothetical protein HGA35_05745 [Erysipelotrichaceae bacterium]|nr:hypothetical protein [Erysipelotrichaceae bacterium]